MSTDTLEWLATNPLFSFSEWPNPSVPKVAASVYGT